MRRTIARVCRDEGGYVFALALIAMPLMLGLSLLIIDVSRANNLHTDLQNAVDALALAGARELDGGVDAITRSDTAIATLLENQARFSDGGAVFIDETQVSVVYLDAIPSSDDTLINAAWITDHETDVGSEAEFVLVRSTPRTMTSLFPIPVGWTQDTVNVGAEAVATYTASACEVTPLFICNPFEGETPSFKERFNTGDLYARQIVITGNGSTTAGPGNFGFLRVGGSGANVLGQALATNHPSACYNTDNIETEPGGNWGQVDGLNTRFDIYQGNFGSSKGDHAYRPAKNIRKGAEDPDDCNSYDEAPPADALALPPGTLDRNFLGGGSLYQANWTTALEEYWNKNHPADGGVVPTIPKATYPGTGTPTTPSRYDVYRYEIEQTYTPGGANLLGHPDYLNPNGHRANGLSTGERGSPQCYTGPADTGTEDRRVIFAAVVDCTAADMSGQTTIAPAYIQGFLNMFVTKPVTGGSVKTMSMEIIDFSGYSGNNSLELSLREEAFLVR